MRAVVIKEFPGRPDNEAVARQVKAGETITGDLALVAVGEGWAEEEKASMPAKALDDMSVDELKEFAQGASIDLAGSTKKADIRAAIDAALAPKA